MVYFQTKNPKIWMNLGGNWMENVGIFHGHLVYFTDTWYISEPFGIFCGNLVNSSRFGMFGPRKIWQPCFKLAWLSVVVDKLKSLKVLFCEGLVNGPKDKRKCSRAVCTLHHEGCQMVCFQTKNPNLSQFWRDLDRKMLTYIVAIWNIL
jgi:hypothetical protein